MDSLRWTLSFLCFCLEAAQTEASSWTISVPSLVQGLPGSCVVIPCSFDYPDPERTPTHFTGIWNNPEHEHIYHPVQSEMMQQYRNRTELMGDVRQKSCSLKIDPLKESDHGPFHFRIKIKDYNSYSYNKNQVSITMISELNHIDLSVEEEITEGKSASASCSVSHSCPSSPPSFNWSHSGKTQSQSQQLENGQWKATSTLTFHPTCADHNKSLQCTVTYKGGRHHKTFKVLKVKYAPVNVKVEFKSDVKEGEAVRLKCSSDAHPPASSYEWHNDTGAQLHRGNVLILPNVSRHQTGALYCTAINSIGQGKSSPVRLTVLYAPEIRTVSACSSNGNMMKCVCIVESKPPSMVHFVLSDRVLPRTKLERHGSVTIGTLQTELGPDEFIYCLANNTQGSANVTLFLPVNSQPQRLYIIIAAGAGVILLILLIAVGVVQKCRRRSGDALTTHMSAMRANKVEGLSQYAATKREEMKSDDAHCPSIYANSPTYGNMGTDWDDAIYANM